MADKIPAGPVLCLAEGEGRNAVFLAERGHAVTAVDMSKVGLDKCAALAAKKGVQVTTQVADLGEYDLGESKWSAIVSIWAHVPPALRIALHDKVVAGLAPGGVFVLEAYNPANVGRGVGGPPVSEMCMPLDLVRGELKPLTFDIGHEIEREVHEGEFHNGLSAVTQVLARKV